MNRTIKDATVKVFHYDDLHSLKAHVLAFVTAYNFAKHLKALKWRTPYQVICEAWTKAPQSSKSIRTTSFRDHTPSAPGDLAGVSALIGDCVLWRRQFLQLPPVSRDHCDVAGRRIRV